ncbi:MAG TPA: YggS family pyridoxal phosphate-dependent enzyme [Solirubrobacteraceae bacterium]|nr:YggS family pyridoxal phosphate-dependent enzyme [Solirubrobacteraceae bacterium]
MAEFFSGLTAERVAANLAAVRERIDAAARRAGRDPGGVEIVAACKYVAAAELGALAAAGIEVLGENRAQDLEAKVAAHGDAFRWDFIGHVQSRKVKQIAPLVRLIHSVSTDSVLAQLERHAPPGLRVLVEVNIAGEEGKDGIAPAQLAGFIERCPVPVAGLMTMPPLAAVPEDSRRWFRALRELAAEHGLAELSMGTTQDYEVAVEEGATLVRIGTRLFRS